MEIYVRKPNEFLPERQRRTDHHEGDPFKVIEDGEGSTPAPKSVFWLLKVPGVRPGDLSPDGIKTWEQYLTEPEYSEPVEQPDGEIIPGQLILRKVRRLTRTPDPEAPMGGLTVDEAQLLQMLGLNRVVEGPVSTLHKLIKNKKEEAE